MGLLQLVRERKGRRKELPPTAEEQPKVQRGKCVEYGILQFQVPPWELRHLSNLQGLAITVPI